jgi:hypothetical protein
MSRKKRQQDLQKAKDKKMKKVAVGLAVVLAVVLAFEVPKMLKHGGSSSAAAAQAVATTPSTSAAAPTTAAPTTPSGTAAAAVMPVTSSKLPNSDTLPRAGKAQLFAFSHFASKDPFVQQVNPAATSSTSSSSSNSGSSTKYKPPTAAIGTTAAVTHQTGRALAVAGAARISVNGRIQVVRVGTSFPSANPVFRLVSVKGGVARIGIASGSYSSGAQTVSLTAGRTLTLVDTADGIRYQLRFLAA